MDRNTVFPRILLISAAHLTRILNKANTEALAHADCTHGAQFFSVWSSSLSKSAKGSVSEPLSLPAIISGDLRGSISSASEVTPPYFKAIFHACAVVRNYSRASINSLIVTNSANTIRGRIKFEGEKIYSELSLFRSPMGLAQVAGISRWPHFRVPRDTRGYIRDSVTCILQGHCDWLVQ